MTRSRIRALVLVPLALAGALGATVAFAGAGGFSAGPHAMIEGRIDALADELGVDDDQRVEIEGIVDRAKADGEALHERHEDLRGVGIELFAAETLDPGAIETHRQDMLLAIDEGTRLMSDTLLDVAEVLSPEQRRALADKAKAFHDDAGSWRDRARAHHGPFGH